MGRCSSRNIDIPLKEVIFVEMPEKADKRKRDIEPETKKLIKKSLEKNKELMKELAKY